MRHAIITYTDAAGAVHIHRQPIPFDEATRAYKDLKMHPPEKMRGLKVSLCELRPTSTATLRDTPAVASEEPELAREPQPADGNPNFVKPKGKDTPMYADVDPPQARNIIERPSTVEPSPVPIPDTAKAEPAKVPFPVLEELKPEPETPAKPAKVTRR